MKTCAACHEDLPKEKFSKKQWKLNQRRCKVCIASNREVQQLRTENNENNNEVGSLLSSMSISDQMIPVSDEELFKQPPQDEEDCPICFLRLPSLWSGHKYMTCCGKVICSGCIHAVGMRGNGQLCPFCRTPTPTGKELIQRTMKRVDAGDAEALFNLGCRYHLGTYGFRQDMDKALELWHRSGELGCSNAYHNIGYAYENGEGVERDEKKAKHYYELAAMGGCANARYNLGNIEGAAGNWDRALKHYMISARSGHGNSLKQIKQLYTIGYATKEDFGIALRAQQSYLDEIKSDQRDKAASHENDKYY